MFFSAFIMGYRGPTPPSQALTDDEVEGLESIVQDVFEGFDDTEPGD